MNAIILRLECLTNLHVGNGDVNYNIIDNEVERDPVTHYPVIHASGVKGALREYFKRNGHKDSIKPLFGKESDKEDKNTSPGKLKILSAEMLAIPVRASAGDKPYYLVSTETAVKRYYLMKREFLGCKAEDEPAPQSVRGVQVDGKTPGDKVDVDGLTLYRLSDADFAEIALPVLARNCLDDGGVSKNLWYEEVVPHESVFFFPVLADKLDRDFLRDFREAVEGKIVQFGGNASIGYGLCKVTVTGGREDE